MVCRFYRWACRKWGPRIDGRRVTFSAAAYCRHHYRRETRSTTDAKGPNQ
jgi:hypothetical protein